MHIEKARETIINVWYFADVQYSFPDIKRYMK